MNDLPCLHSGCFSSARFVARDNRAALAHVCRLCFADLSLEEQSFYAEHEPRTLAPSAPPDSEPTKPSFRRTIYLVQPGDSPYKIAQKCAPEPSRWRELIKANPSKVLTRDGISFASLRVGEALILPEGWEP
jgi:hypothetical protein